MSGQHHRSALHSLAWTALVFCLVAAWGTGALAEDVVRVLVAEGRPALTLAGAGPLTLTDGTGQRTLGQRAAGGEFRLAFQRGGILVRDLGRTVPRLIAWPGSGAVLALDGRPYRGRLEVQSLDGGLVAVNVVDLEDYLQGVLKDEIPAGWPAEAAKAMAIAARTYAVYQRLQNPGGLFHLRGTTASQVYGGARGEDLRTNWAVQATRGQILVFGGQPISAFYHSCSGGATEDATDVFGMEFDTLPGVKDDFSLTCPYSLWIERLTSKQIEGGLARAGYPVGRILDIVDLVRSRTGRILRIEVRHTRGTLVLEGRRFREAMGSEVIRSTDFEIRPNGSIFTFVGRGSGHGVGMSQWGAKEMAELAFQYQDILKFYYPLATIGVLSESSRR
jgi:stage II sporulation protein D